MRISYGGISPGSMALNIKLVNVFIRLLVLFQFVQQSNSLDAKCYYNKLGIVKRVEYQKEFYRII